MMLVVLVGGDAVVVDVNGAVVVLTPLVMVFVPFLNGFRIAAVVTVKDVTVSTDTSHDSMSWSIHL